MANIILKIKDLSIITIIASLLIGIILITKPNEALEFVSIALGASIALIGVGSWIAYFVKKSNSIVLAFLGTLALITGIVICVKYNEIINILIYIFGTFLILSGVIDFVSALSAKKNNLKLWAVTLAISAATVVLGILVIIFDTKSFIIRLLGVSLIVYAVNDIISFVQIKRIAKLTTVVDNDVTEIDVTQNDIE